MVLWRSRPRRWRTGWRVQNDDAARINRAYKLVYGREPSSSEVRAWAGVRCEEANSAWPQYMQVLLTSTEFSSVN